MTKARAAIAILVGFVAGAVLATLAADAIHPTLRMVSIPVTVAVAVLLLVVTYRRASRP